ncbi:MAG: PDGLE domain-containing protein [Actinomycetales bacterium]|nr:PDGLE domain-containing protein [Actinomycetales bacterium]
MRRSIWIVIGVGLAVALVAAGFLSYYASSAPDGLEKVAEDHGFIDTAQDSAMASLPTAGYAIEGLGNDRLSSGLAGVLGVLVMIVVGFGLFWLLGRGRRSGQAGVSADDHAQVGG